MAKSHDFLAASDTHSNLGKIRAFTIPPELKAFWSHGTNYQAGIGLMLKNEFLDKFNPCLPKDWQEIEPGRSAILHLKGPQGAMDIAVIYWATGEGSKASRKRSREALAGQIAPANKVLTVLAGDFNYVTDRSDRICAKTAALTAAGDQDDGEHFQQVLGIPHGLAEWSQQHFTHSNTIGRSRIDRMYCNQHVTTQLDRDCTCAALSADQSLSTHRPISFRRSGKDPNSAWNPPLPLTPLADPRWRKRVQLCYEEKRRNDGLEDSAFRKLLLLKDAGVVPQPHNL